LGTGQRLLGFVIAAFSVWSFLRCASDLFMMCLLQGQAANPQHWIQSTMNGGLGMDGKKDRRRDMETARELQGRNACCSATLFEGGTALHRETQKKKDNGEE
jgi:hypothetical protein